MTPNEIKVTGRKLTFSDATIRRNPGLFVVGALENTKRQQNQRCQSEDKSMAGIKTGVGYRVTVISCRSRMVDAHDNLRTGAKSLVDRITETLGFASDDDPRLQWEYGQVISENEGTIVKIERNSITGTKEG